MQGCTPRGFFVAPDMASNANEIRENALKPRRARGDEGEVEQFSIRDQIEADRYAQEQAAGGRSRLPIRFAKIKPGGA